MAADVQVIEPRPVSRHVHELPDRWVYGTLAQCEIDDCNLWFKAVANTWTDYQMSWLRVSWYNFKSKKRIRAYQEGALHE